MSGDKPGSAGLWRVCAAAGTMIFSALVAAPALSPPAAGPASPPASTSADDPRFRDSYSRQYELTKGLAPDMVVEELRLRVELVASRGSQVGAASNDRRVRGFETALLQSLQAALCGTARPPPAVRPSAVVVDSVTGAANGQLLHVRGTDVAELSALAQRLVDSHTRARLCSLRSLDEVR